MDSPTASPPEAKPDKAPEKGESWIDSPSFPFVAPLLLYMLMLMLESDEDGSKYYMYPVKAIVVGALIVWVWKRLPKIEIKAFWLSFAVGVVGIVQWIALEPYLVWGEDKYEGGYNPYLYAEEYGYGMTVVVALLFMRVFGAAVVVPIAEEIFWRGFLMRFLINPNKDKIKPPKDKLNTLAWLDYDLDRFTYDHWSKNPLGQYRPVSFWFTTCAFCMVHGQYWTVAFIYGVLVGWLFCKTKSLGDAIFAHAVSNLILGLYVIYTGYYWFW